VFLELCPEICDPSFWAATQERVRAGIEDDVFPYPKELRFPRCFGAPAFGGESLRPPAPPRRASLQ
jgi:isocitrate dehydrogenase kinase/phosphatase